jgi:hypothetical protein
MLVFQIQMLILDLQSILLNADRNMRCLDGVFYLRIESSCLTGKSSFDDFQ